MKWRVAVDRALVHLDLTHAQYVMLASLLDMERDGRRPSQRELADYTGLEALYVSKLARALDADGMIQRTRDPEDTRAVRLSLTGQGRDAVIPAIAAVQSLLDRLLAPLGGRDHPRAAAFVRDVTVLLDVPLDPIGLRNLMPEIHVLDSTIFYEDSGSGTPLVFLHGNPSSSHLWRKILPDVGHGRLLAPDLIGMGRSGKPDIDYSFADHARYLDTWFDTLDLDQVVLVGHDWGGALAFDWAARHPEQVLGVAFCESIVKPIAWQDLSPQAREHNEAIRTPGVGEKMALERNLFIRQAFTAAVLTPTSNEDLESYLAPYPTPDSRRPVLAWARQMPIGGEPADLISRIREYDKWLASSAATPKLLMTFDGSPTLLITGDTVDWCAANIAALEIVHCGNAGHQAPEDRSAEIAVAISAWADRHQLR